MAEQDRSTEGESSRERLKARLWAAWFVAFFASYMLLVGVWVAEELLAAAFAAAVSATIAEVVRVQDIRKFRPRLRWLLRAYRLPPSILADCGVVFGALWRHLVKREEINGAFRAFRIPIGGLGERAAARRALLNAAISITPNTYVVGIDEDNDVVLVHQLVPCERSLAREEIMSKL
jgi:multisubunit Na+/H+ antiporter MnhE subunit